MFLADESLELPIIIGLRAAGFHVRAVSDETPRASDSRVLAMAHADELILVTNDKDFGMLACRNRAPCSGIVLLRMPKLESRSKLARLIQLLDDPERVLRGALTVVMATDVRRRALPVLDHDR